MSLLTQSPACIALEAHQKIAALKSYGTRHLKPLFVSNVDGVHDA